MKDISHVLFMGDINLPLINWSSRTCRNNSENSFDNTSINCLRDSFVHQHVTIPTCSRYNQNPSILNFILTNEEGIISSLSHISPLEKSDLSIFTFNFHCYIQHRRHYRIHTYNTEDTTEYIHTTQKTLQNTYIQHRRHDRIQCNYNKGDYSTMRAQLSLDWNCIPNNKCVNDQWFTLTIMSILHRSTVSLLRPIQPMRRQGMTKNLITKASSR